MAKMVPQLTDDQLDRLRSQAEAKFYRACRDQLSDQFLVLHSVNWIRPRVNRPPRDGESDFVVFDKDAGFSAIEVKGGGISFDPTTSAWQSISRTGARFSIKDPFQQAKIERYAINDQLTAHPRWTGRRASAGHAAIFPDLDEVSALVSPQSPRAIIGGRRDLQDIKSWLAKVASFWNGEGVIGPPLGDVGMRIVEDVFCKPVEVRPLVSSILCDEEIVRIRLTQQQSRQLRMLGTRKRASICGGAGTGKTLLALEKARQLADTGRQTLLLCYNRALADHLKVAVGERSDLLPMTFHQLCDWFSRKAKIEAGLDVALSASAAYPGADYWHVQMPFALALAAEALDDRFDAIIVDEGQDFRSDYWFAIDGLLRDPEDSLLYVFYDPNQAVYQRLEDLPIQDAPFPLTTNCRNTQPIHDAAYSYFVGDETDPPEIHGTPVDQIVEESLRDQAREIHRSISQLLTSERVPPSEIVVLVAGYPKQTYYDLLAGFTLPKGIHWSREVHRQPSTVLVDTVHRFKGLEAGIVYLWGFDDLTMESDRETIYVGISRAKSRLYVVGKGESVQQILSAGSVG